MNDELHHSENLFNEENSLLDLAFAFASDEYPNLDVDGYKSEITMMGKGIQLPLGKDLEMKVKAFMRYFTHDLGFQGNQKDYYNPANSFLNQVIDRRLGIPISLSVLAITMGKEAGLRIFGVGLPGHFVNLACEGRQKVYFDLFQGGRILEYSDCQQLARGATGTNFTLTDQHLEPVNNLQIITRMLSNLRIIYERSNDTNRLVKVLRRMADLHPTEPSLMKELGISLCKSSRHSEALKWLQKYQSHVPEAMQDESFKSFLKLARQEESLRN